MSQTDRQTDGRLTIALPRSALASRGKMRHTAYMIQLVLSTRQIAPPIQFLTLALYKYIYLLTYLLILRYLKIHARAPVY